jgi:thioredoxin reductase (NADPH)
MYDVIIIGAGSAGLSAAVYTGRGGLKTLVLGIPANSNAYKAHVFEKYLGFEDQISGPDLMGRCLAQAKRLGAEHVEREAVGVALEESTDALEKVGHIFKVIDEENEEYIGKTLIIASGLGFKPSGIRREKEVSGKGLSFCVTCDGPFFKDKECVIIGDGNYAAVEALHLLTFTKKITVISHGKEFSISEKLMKDLAERGVKVEKTGRVKSFKGESKLEGITFDNDSVRKVEGAFVALGKASAADFANKLGLQKTGPQDAYIVANPRTGETNATGVFAAGDCTGGNAQVAKSSGEGCNAGISVIKLVKDISAYVDYS